MINYTIVLCIIRSFEIIHDQSLLFRWGQKYLGQVNLVTLGWTYFLPRACTSDSSSASICFKKSICCSWITSQGHLRSAKLTNENLASRTNLGTKHSTWTRDRSAGRLGHPTEAWHKHPTFINWKSSESSLFGHFDIRPWPLVGDIFFF